MTTNTKSQRKDAKTQSLAKQINSLIKPLSWLITYSANSVTNNPGRNSKNNEEVF